MESARNLHTFHEFPENESRSIALSVALVYVGKRRITGSS
jgi:hypothetical protein